MAMLPGKMGWHRVTLFAGQSCLAPIRVGVQVRLKLGGGAEAASDVTQ